MAKVSGIGTSGEVAWARDAIRSANLSSPRNSCCLFSGNETPARP